MAPPRAAGRSVIVLELALRADPNAPLRILCLGAHSDDIEIGCGGTILRLTRLYPNTTFHWVVFSAAGQRQEEALAGANLFLARAGERRVVTQRFRESFFPYAGAHIKELFEEIRSDFEPDLILTHHRHDLHQDHRTIAELTWNTFRSSLILEYEIPKWDGDLGAPNCYVAVDDELADAKIEAILTTFASQRTRAWFTADTFRGLMRLRGLESNVRFAEAFYAKKLVVG
jgi:LmbE family N-acetylglucosaminyl deacetylase